MAKKNATDQKQKGKSATAKSPKKAKREIAPVKPPKSPKKKKAQEPLSREERRKAAWLRKTERKAAAQAVTEVATKTDAGLTYTQLKASGLTARQPKLAGPTLDQTLLEVVAEQTRQFEELAKPVSLPAVPDPEVRFAEQTESVSSIATRNVVEVEIRFSLGKTEEVFRTFYRLSCDRAQQAVEELFGQEPEESPFRLRLAEIVLADDPAVAIEGFLEEVWGQVTELQLIAGSFDPANELEKFTQPRPDSHLDKATVARLQKAAAEEAIRLDLAQRLSGLMTVSAGTPVEVDETFATLIAEAAQAAEAQRRERTTFRRTLSQELRQRKEREGRRFSKPLEEFGDEEFFLFLTSHRGEPGVKQALLALRIETEIVAAERRWTDLKSRLAAGANDPEITVMQNAAAMKDMLGVLAQIRALREQLAKLDQPHSA